MILKLCSQRCLLGILYWNIAASALTISLAMAYFGDMGAGIAIGVMTFLILTFCEILPKSVITSAL
jgi:putative hemolysin